MAQNKKSYSEFISDKLQKQLNKITVPKSQRLMVGIIEQVGCSKDITYFKWYDSKEEFINDIKKNDNFKMRDNGDCDCELLLEVVCRNKQVVISNPNDLYEDYLIYNKFE